MLAATAGIADNQWELTGQRAVGNRFAERLVGEPRAAARRAALMLAALRSADGQWQDLESEAADGGMARLYLSEDKNGRQLRGEAELRRLVRALRQMYPERQFFGNKAKLIVSSDWRSLAKVEVGECSEPVVTKWNQLYVEEIGLDKAAVEEMKAGNAAPREEVQWSQ